MNQKTTAELLHILTSIGSEKSLKSYAAETEHFSELSFTDYYNSLPEVKRRKYPDLIRESGIERTYFYQIMNGNRRPGRDKVILLALAAHLTMEETQRALELSCLGILYARNRRDAILIYAVTKLLSATEAQELLERFGEKPLA